MIGLHGTSLWAARRIRRDGWSAAAASALATPRMETPPDLVYAVWLSTALGRHGGDPLWAARQWAIEAAERAAPWAGPHLRGAVLLVEADDDALVMPRAEWVAPIASVRIVGVVDVGRQLPHRCSVCDTTGMPICDVPWRWRLPI